MSDIKLVALDLDGTLFNNQSQISPRNIEAINQAFDHGIEVVISSGRPLSGMPFEQLKDTPVNYSINTNGSSVYRFSDRKLISEDPMPDDLVFPIIDYLLTKKAHIAAFINGDGVTPESCKALIPDLIVPPSIKYTLALTRIHVPDLKVYLKENNYHIQKVTLNFTRDSEGKLIDREEIFDYLSQIPGLEIVSGGFHNIEFTGTGVDKGIGLHHLADFLGIPIEATMAIGDTENDLAIIKAAGVGVAMANAIPAVKEAADLITASNEEDGVARVLESLCS